MKTKKTTLWDFLEGKINSISERITVDVLPLMQDHVLDNGVQTIVTVGAVSFRINIPPVFIDKNLTLRLRSLHIKGKDKNLIVITKGQVTPFIAFVKEQMIKFPAIIKMLQRYIGPNITVDSIQIPQIPKRMNLVIDNKLEFDISVVGEQNGQKTVMLKYSTERTAIMQKWQLLLDKWIAEREKKGEREQSQQSTA